MDVWNWLTLRDYIIMGVILLIIILYIYFTWTFNFFAKRNVPFRKPIPLFGNAARVVFKTKSLVDLIMDAYNFFEDYSMAGMFQFQYPVFFIRDPELIKIMMVRDFDNFMDHTNLLPDVEPLFSANLTELKGEKWRKMRSILSPTFTSSKMKVMFPLILKCGQQLVDHLEYLRDKLDCGLLELEMKDLFTRYTNDVIASAGFGICCDSLKNPTNDFYTCGKDITDYSFINFIKFIVLVVFPNVMSLLKIRIISKKSSDFLYNTVRETIRIRQKEGIVRPDMIHLLMQARKELKDGSFHGDAPGEKCDKRNIEFGLSETDITGQVMIFLLEGFEMPSTMLSFASILLAINEDVQQRLQAEIDQTLEDYGGKITYDALHNMKYLDMVISETLRVYPPAFATERQCSKYCTIPATRNIPAVNFNPGDRILIPIYAIHHDPNYHCDPEKFNPERFNESNKRNIKPYTYLPFGAGPRGCIGIRFALMETKIALVYLLSKFKLQVTSKTPVPIKFQTRSFQLAPENGFWIGLTSRNNVS